GPERCSPLAWADAHPWSGPGPRPWPSPTLALGPGRRSPLARAGARPWPGPGSSLAYAGSGPSPGPVLPPRPGPPVPLSRPLRPDRARHWLGPALALGSDQFSPLGPGRRCHALAHFAPQVPDLQRVHLVVEPAAGHELVVGARLHDAAAVQGDDEIGLAHHRQ